jgi:hypothetical protein
MTDRQTEIPLPSGLTKDQPMSTELVHVAPSQIAPRPSYAQIIASGYEHGLTTEALAMLVEAQKDDDRRAAEAAYNAAVAKFQSLCPPVCKTRTMGEGSGLKYQYASYDDVMRVAKPHLDACGLAVSFSSETLDSAIKATCRISHGPHHEDHTFTVPIPAMKVNDTQRFGAAMKYAFRYCLTGALNIVVTDDLDSDAAGLCETISEADCRALEQLIVDANADGKRFCHAYGIDRVADLPASQLGQARSQLLRKMSQAKQ